MQGTAADLIKLSMIAVQDWLEASKVGTRMIMQVHDELVLEVPDAELSEVRKRLPELMCGVADAESAAGRRSGRGPELGRSALTAVTVA